MKRTKMEITELKKKSDTTKDNLTENSEAISATDKDKQINNENSNKITGNLECEITCGKSGNLWYGFENKILIKLNGIAYDKIEIKTEPQETLRKVNNTGEYLINLKNTGIGQTLKISVSHSLTKKVLGTNSFKVLTISDPMAAINTRKADNIISKGVFKTNKSLFIDLGNDFFKDLPGVTCAITSFKYRYVSNGDKTINGSVSGPNFDNQLINLIDNCNKNDLFIFEDIRAICPGDKVSRNLNIVKVKIL